MNGRTSQIKRKLLDSETNMSYMAFQTAMTKLIDKVTQQKLNIADSFSSLINTKELFTKRGKKYQLHIDWPQQSGGYKDLHMIAFQENAQDNVNREQSLEFYCDDSLFLKITCRGEDEVIIEKDLTFKTKMKWSDIDIDELISNFNQVLRANQFTYINKKPKNENVNINKNEFAQLIHQYKDRNITYRIENVILKNAIQKANEFVFYINWVDAQNEHHLLKAIFSRSDLFFLPTNDYPGYSWVLTENALLTAFPEYRRYDIHAGQFFYSLKIFELPSGQKTGKQNEILNMWLTSDALFGELHHVGKGTKLSGNEVLNIYNYLDQLFRVKYTFICDAASLVAEDDSINIPLRLILALVMGKTWYEDKLSGVRLFECNNFPTVANGVISQNIEKRNLALRELQQLSLKSWYEMLETHEQRQLYKLYLAYFETKKPRRSSRLKGKEMTSFNDSITIQDLTTKIYNASKGAKTVLPDLMSLIELLSGKGPFSAEESVDKSKADFWVKQRVNELLSGSTFWIKERKDEVINIESDNSLRTLMR